MEQDGAERAWTRRLIIADRNGPTGTRGPDLHAGLCALWRLGRDAGYC